MSRAVLKDFVLHPEPVHPAIYAFIVLGKEIGITVVVPSLGGTCDLNGRLDVQHTTGGRVLMET